MYYVLTEFAVKTYAIRYIDTQRDPWVCVYIPCKKYREFENFLPYLKTVEKVQNCIFWEFSSELLDVFLVKFDWNIHQKKKVQSKILG